MIGVREEASEAAFLTRGGEGHGDDVGKNQMWVRKGGLETVDERRKGRGESWIGASVWIMAVPMGTGKGQGRVGQRLEARAGQANEGFHTAGVGLRSGGREGDARGGLPGSGGRGAGCPWLVGNLGRLRQTRGSGVRCGWGAEVLQGV